MKKTSFIFLHFLLLITLVSGCKNKVDDQNAKHQIDCKEFLYSIEDQTLLIQGNILDSSNDYCFVQVDLYVDGELANANDVSGRFNFKTILESGNHHIILKAIDHDQELVLLETNILIYRDRLDEFIHDSINDNMSDHEKVEKLIQYAQTFEYDYNINNYEEMLEKGRGECFANTDLMIEFCKRVGIKASIATRSNTLSYPDYHINTIALLDGESYLIDHGHVDRNRVEFEKTKGYSYMILQDGTIAITDYDSYCEELVIPEIIDGYTVSRIDPNAFAYHFELISVLIPKCVTTIGNKAFYQCTSLKTVKIEADHIQLDGDVFLAATPVVLGNTEVKVNHREGNLEIESNSKDVEGFAEKYGYIYQ